MTEKYIYSNGVALLEEWEDVNYCEHSFKFKDEWLTDKEVVDLLNDLNELLKIRFNEEREKSLKFCRNIDTLTIENEQLKSRVEYLERKIDRERTSYQKQHEKWEEEIQNENEQLKKDVEYWKQVASQYNNELNVFKHCKKYKTECKDIHWSSD